MGKIMLNGKQYGVGGITDADDVKYTSSQTVKGALDKLNAGLTYTSETINSTYAQGIIFKWGRVVTVVINNGDQGTIAANTTLTTLPAAYKPANVAEFINTYAKTRIRINGDGSIVAVEAINNSYVRGCVTYIAAS